MQAFVFFIFIFLRVWDLSSRGGTGYSSFLRI